MQSLASSKPWQRLACIPWTSSRPSWRGGGLVRFRADGDRPGNLNGWAVFRADKRPAGAFGHYRLGVHGTWRFEKRSKFPGALPSISDPNRWGVRAECVRSMPVTQGKEAGAGYARHRADRAAGDLAQHSDAQARAKALWEAAKPAPAHPYSDATDLLLAGLRSHGGRLLVPRIKSRVGGDG